MRIRAAIGVLAVVTLSLLPTAVQAVDYDFVSVYSGGTALPELGATVPSVNTSGTIAFAALVFDPAANSSGYVVFRGDAIQLLPLLNLSDVLGVGSPSSLVINDAGAVAVHYSLGTEAAVVRINADGSFVVLARADQRGSAPYLEFAATSSMNAAGPSPARAPARSSPPGVATRTTRLRSTSRVSLPSPACSQSIAFGPLADRTFGDPPFSVTATASSGLPVSFAASGRCTIAGGIVTLAGSGCTVTASQDGNADYEPAPDVARAFTVVPAGQTIAFAALPGCTFGDPPFTLTATASSGLSVSFGVTGGCSLDGDRLTIAAAGGLQRDGFSTRGCQLPPGSRRHPRVLHRPGRPDHHVRLARQPPAG